MSQPHESGQTRNGFNQQRVTEVMLSDFRSQVIKSMQFPVGVWEASTMPGGPPGESTRGALASIPSLQVIPAPVRDICMKNFPDDSSSPRSLSLSGSLIGPVTGAEKSHSHVPCLNSQPRNSVSKIRWWWFQSLGFGVIC